jgi:ELWxxDGT repeat protein
MGRGHFGLSVGSPRRRTRAARGRIVVVLALALGLVVLTAAAPAWGAAPALVSDIDPGVNGSSPSEFTTLNGVLFFDAVDGTHGDELWRSDGTAAGTTMVKDINPAAGSSISELIAVAGTLYFRADDGTHGSELWRSDGTAVGTTMVKDINAGGTGSTPLDLTGVGGILFFSADDGVAGRELWRSDGTAAGTTMVKDIKPGGTSFPTDLVSAGGTLFFHADDGVHGDELWKSDGTSAGTTLVKDVNSGGGSSNISDPTNVNGTLFFSAFDGNSLGLWKSDGTAAGTSLVKSLGSVAEDLTNVAGTLFFAADDGNHGLELWKSDGTGAGTMLVKDINPGAAASEPATLTDFNGTVFFQANDGTNGVQLWKSDGTAAGTVLVKVINPAADSFPDLFTTFEGRLYFSAFDGADGREIWKTDGTGAGTVMVADINPGGGSSSPSPFTDLNGTLLFGADDGTHGTELWKLAGTGTPTSTVVGCLPATVGVGTPTTCTAIVSNGGATAPTGPVGFSTDSSGTFDSGGTCQLAPTGTPGKASCHLGYTPAAVGSGTHTITASYHGDASDAASSGQSTVIVPGGGGGGGPRPTSTSVSCAPASVSVGSSSGCGATVTDTGNGSAIAPTGTVSFSTDSHGTFSNSSCALVRVNAMTAGCVVGYTPTAVDSGVHAITAAYGGDGAHNVSSGFGTVGAAATLATPPQNTALPSFGPDRSCQWAFGRPFCQVIPFQYVCNPGSWAGNDPAVPYQFEWQELYYARLGGILNPVWQQVGTGQTYYAVQRVSSLAPSGAFRCVVTATGPGGSTVAYSAAANLQVGPPLPRGLPAPVNIIVTGIEVTQAVQNSGCAGCTGTLPSRSQSSIFTPGQATYQGVTLAAGKFTVVRVYAHYIQNGAPAPLAKARAQLEVLDSAGTRLSTPQLPDSAPAAGLTPLSCRYCVSTAERANPDSSFNFLIPWQETAHRSLTFRATVTPPFGVGLCGGCGANVFTLDSVPFVPTATVPIYPIPLTIGSNASNCGIVRAIGCTTQTPQQVFDDTTTVLPEQFQIFPWDAPLQIDGTKDACAAAAKVSERGAVNQRGVGDYGVGVFTASSGNVKNGCTLGGYTLFNNGAASAVLDSGRSLTSVTHEIGHGLSLVHADTTPHPDGTRDCGGNSNGQTGESWPPGSSSPDNEGRLNSVGLDRRPWDIFTTGSLPRTFVDGFDTAGNPASNLTLGGQYFDFMSYCAPTSRTPLPFGATTPLGVVESADWISVFNWNRLIAYHPPPDQLPAAADGQARAAQGNPLRVVAIVDPDGNMSTFDVVPGQTAPGGPTPGSPYRIELRDRSGQVLDSVVPTTAEMHVDFSGRRPDVLLDATLPFVPATGAVTISADGQVLASRTRSAHAPTARFLSPRRGTLLAGRTTLVRWGADDADSDRLTAAVDYSADGGRHWKVVADGLTGGSARVPSRSFSASRDARIRVRISDGFDVTTVTSGRLVARGAPPVVQIIGAPRRGHVLATATLLFQGSAFDDADRPLTGRHLKWYAGKRLIGTGEQVTANDLPPGSTAIRLIATDSRGRSAKAILPLRVRAVPADFLLFDAPLLVSARARTVRITVASSAPATLTIAGKHYAISQRVRRITVVVPRGKSLIRLPCTLRSRGGVVRGTYVALRA